MLFASNLDHANRPSPRRRAAGEGATVLLIGSLRCRETLRALLEPAGHAVLAADDADEGLRMARKLRPQVAFIELAMPGRDGWATARQLKADAETFLIPLVAVSLTAHPSGTYHRARSAGFVDFISRPIERRHVVEVAATWARVGTGL